LPARILPELPGRLGGGRTGTENQITVELIEESDNVAAIPDCVGGQGDAPVEDWTPECGLDAKPFDIDAINRRLAEEHGIA
jgi:hypothetical protein